MSTSIFDSHERAGEGSMRSMAVSARVIVNTRIKECTINTPCGIITERKLSTSTYFPNLYIWGPPLFLAHTPPCASMADDAWGKCAALSPISLCPLTDACLLRGVLHLGHCAFVIEKIWQVHERNERESTIF